MRTRLVPYVPFGAKKDPLPDALESQIVTPLGELPTAQVHYHRQGVNAVALDGITELAVEYWDGTGWAEPPSCRFLSMRGAFDHLEETPTRKYVFIGIGWMLRQAKVWEPAGLPVDADGKVQFLSANAGQIMGTLIQNAKGRGWGAGISVDFTSTADSAGKAWTKIVTIAYDLDLDLEAILSNLYQQGVCDYRWEGRTLRIFNPDTTMGRDLSTGANPVRLIVNDGQTSAPEDWTNEDLLTDALVLGDDGRKWTFANGATTPLGRLERVITQGGVSDAGTASLLADQELIKGSRTRISYTREFVVMPDSRVWPFRDYLPGDWVSAQRGTGFELLRTHSLSLTINEDGVKGHAVLGDRLEDLLTKLAKRTKGITGGASAGGSGARPAPEGPDTRVPAAPKGLVVAADAYLDKDGTVQGVVQLDWAHDGTATNGTTIGIDRYQVYYRENVLGAVWKQLTATQDTETSYSPLPVATSNADPAQYAFKVRAVADNARASAFSAQYVAVMEKDTTAPPVPEFRAGDVTTWLRTVSVHVTGKGAAGEAMPLDFSHFNVYEASSPTATGALVSTKPGEGAGLAYQSGTMPTDVTVWYYVTAVDRSGNESDPSARQSITPAANVNVAAIASEIDGALIRAGTVAREMLSEPVQGELASAGSANQNQYAGTAPTTRRDGSPLKVGDQWFDTAEGYLLSEWSGSKWVPRPMGHQAIATLDLGKATVGELDGLRIKAGSIYADRIVSGLSQNMVPDPGFNNADINAQRLSRAAGYGGATFEISGGALSITITGTPAGNPNMALAGNDDYYAWASYPGMKVIARVEARVAAPGAGQITMNLRYRRRDGSVTSTAMNGGYRTITADWAEYDWGFVFPQDVDGFSVALQVSRLTASGVIEFRAPFVASAVGTTVIEEGAITTGKIAADAVAAIHIKSLAIETDKLAANAVTADKANIGSLRAGILTANVVDSTMIRSDAITAKHTITGATVQTSSAPARGIKMMEEAFVGYDPYGRNTFLLDAVTGAATVVGEFRTQFEGSPAIVLVNQTTQADLPGLWFSSDGTTSGQEAAIYMDDTHDVVFRGKSLGGGVLAKFIVNPGFWAYDGFSAGGTSESAASSYGTSAWVGTDLTVGRAATIYGDLVANQRVKIYDAPTTSVTPNAFLNVGGDGYVYRVTSLRAAKIDIRNVGVDPELILDVPVRDWYDRGQYEALPEGSDFAGLRRIPGVVAEELVDAGLAEFCSYDQDGKLTGVHYDRLALLLIPVVRDLRNRLDRLTGTAA